MVVSVSTIRPSKSKMMAEGEEFSVFSVQDELELEKRALHQRASVPLKTEH
jgi:hypothetical protein